MTRRRFYKAVIIPVLLVFAVLCIGCGKKTTPELKLRVAPLEGVYVQYESQTNSFRIGNALVERRIFINTETRFIYTNASINKLTRRNYIRSLSEEFSLRANGVELSGVTGDFEYVSHEISGSGGIRALEIKLRAAKENVGLLEVKLVYEVYSGTPVIRKWLEVDNLGGSSVTIDSIRVEVLSLMPGLQYDLDIYTKSSMGKDALSPVVFDTRLLEGFVLGNESPGVLRYYDLYSDDRSVSIGMNPYTHTPPFEFQLAPGEKFTSPPVFILFFKGEPSAAENSLEKFTAEFIARPVQQYSVWYENIPVETIESEIRQKVQMAAESGADIFCMTGNWMGKRGDWNTREDLAFDKISQYAHSLDMRFGLSMELAVADQDSRILAEYPQWTVSAGESSNENVRGGKMMCLGSDYTIYIAQHIDRLMRQFDLDYIRFVGQIIPDGCSNNEHMHRTRAESLWYIYDGLFALCEHLHSQNYDLIIDIPGESYAPDGVLDYALLKYADLSWPF